MGMGHIAPVINKVPHGHGTYNLAINKVPQNFIYCRGYMSHAHGHILPFLILLISIFINTYFVIHKNKLILYNASCIISVK
jgi:hypothetical protein